MAKVPVRISKCRTIWFVGFAKSVSEPRFLIEGKIIHIFIVVRLIHIGIWNGIFSPAFS